MEEPSIMVQRIIVTLVALFLLAVGVSADTWHADAAHSSVNFTVTHMVISTVNGKFDSFEGTLDWDGNDVTTGIVEFTIQTSSVDTDNEKRDGHLSSPDFFDVAQYPTITFKSTKVIPGDGKNFQLVGDMTMHGVTKPVTFDCTYNGSIPFMKTVKAGFSAKATINRKDFGVSWSRALDGGGLVVSDEVEIDLALEFNKEVPDSEG